MADNMLAESFVAQDIMRSLDEGQYAYPKLNHRGEACVIDFYTQMAMEKRGFEVRAGIDSTTETGDAPIATTAADIVVQARAGLTVIPTYFNVSINTAAGTAHQIHLKCVAGSSSGGTAFTPLPLWTDSDVAAVSTALMNEEGGCTVVADALTTTTALFLFGSSQSTDDGPFNLSSKWKPLLPAFCAGNCHVYAQIGSASTGPEYHATLHYIEIPTTAIE